MSERAELTDRDAERLRTLLARRRELERGWGAISDELALAVLDICEREGVSRSQVARALGVGTSTVQGWVNRGRQLRAG